MEKNKKCFLCVITKKGAKLMKNFNQHWCGASMAINGLNKAGYDVSPMLCADCLDMINVLKKNACEECK